jgi:hypothetical protein
MAVAVAAVAAPVAASASTGSAVCSGGSVAPGSYTSLTISGFCQVDAGDVHVSGNLTVAPGAGLLAAFGGSDITVGGNLRVRSGAILALGCEPVAFPCFNDPDQQVGTLSTHHSLGGNLVATGALMVLAHNNTIGGRVVQTGGGGGVTCDNFPLGPDGPPAYTTYEDNTIAGGANVVGVHTCWMGFIRNTVSGTVVYNGNKLADPDANEVVTNTIGGNLVCNGNDPATQVGDSGGSPNNVHNRAVGQCAGLV